MKRKIQFLLFTLIIAFIIFIAIFVGINEKENNILPENNNIETEENAILEGNTNIQVENNVLLEEDTDASIKFSPMAANIILPPGSTSEDLQTAIYNATSGDVIIISANITYTSTSPAIIIPADKEITIQCDANNNWVLSQSRNSIRHFTVNGTLTLQNLVLEGGKKGGGLTVNSGATFNMNNSTTIQNCYNYDGGAVMNSGIFNMYEAIITQCSGGNGGAVRCAANGQFNIYGGTISNNSAIIGGGVIINYLR